jgi:prolactin regulatory element-binding protein
MRARHTAHSTPTFPVYSAAFLSPTELILGGGGGASKTGIKNKLVRRPYSRFDPDSSFFFQRLYHVDEFLTLKIADELQLESGEDAPMSMAVHPDVRPSCKGPPSVITCLFSPRRDPLLCVESTAPQKWSRRARI